MRQLVSLSGGKDSTAMLLMMLERGERVDAAVYFDAGEWEFPFMREHMLRVERTIAPIPLVRLSPRKPFTHFLLHQPVRPRGGGEISHFGWRWPSPLRRWCTKEKTRTINRYVKDSGGGVQCIGYAAEEVRRTQTKNMLSRAGKVRFPLIEWGVTEPEALRYCQRLGFDWGGLYDIFPRVSCFCCPLQSLGELRKLRKYFPNLWGQMLVWESEMPTTPHGFNRFNGESTVHDLEARFAEEDRQIMLPGFEEEVAA